LIDYKRIKLGSFPLKFMLLYNCLGDVGMGLNKLIIIEEKLEECFIELANLEANGKKDSLEYLEYFNLTNEYVEEEKRVLDFLTPEEIKNIRKQILKHCNKKECSLALGHLVDACYIRLLNIFNALLGSEAFDYEAYLRYDLNQIIFSFLEYLINNEYYEEIKNDLIYYKYNLIFLNYLSENDFLKTSDISTISIESKSFKTDDNYDLIFVDKTKLILEGKEHISALYNLSDDFKENSNEYALAVISIIELLARLILSENDILHYIQQDFDMLLEDDSLSIEIKNLIQDMLIILEQLKNKIILAR